MVSLVNIREATPADRPAIRKIVEAAFEQPAEATLTEAIVADGDAVLELVAEKEGEIVGHVLFSRLQVNGETDSFAAVALAPVGVSLALQRSGIGGALIREGHKRLETAGEKLSVVLGDPAYYSRFGYQREPAEAYDCDYQCEALQALFWGDAPRTGRLVYARAFSAL